MAILPITAGYYEGYYSEPIEDYIEASTQTYKKGALMVFSSGKVAENGNANPTADSIGFSTHAFQGVDKQVKIAVAAPGTVFEGTFSNAGTPVAVAQTDVGVAHGVNRDGSTGLWYVDKADTNGTFVRIVAIKDPIGTLDARVYFKVLQTNSVFNQ